LVSLQKITVSLVLLLLSAVATADGFYRPAAGAGEAGMAYVCIMKPGLWSSFHNQASLSYYHNAAFSFSYENRFAIKELAVKSACLIIPAGSGSAGIFYSRSGFTGYRRETIAMASGLKLASDLSAGVQIDLFAEHQQGEYKDYLQVSCEAGLIYEPSRDIRVGIHIFNPIPNSLRNIPMPSSIRAGAGMTISEGLFAGFEAELVSGRKPVFRSGFEYATGKKAILRCGYSTAEPSFTFGIGFLTGPASVDIAFSTHPRLGITSGLTASFVLVKNP